MQRILVSEAKEGMILAKDVENSDGRLLCGKGTTLDQRLIARLHKMDIASIIIQSEAKAEDKGKLVEELRRVEARFSRVTAIPPLMLLKKKIMKRIIASQGII